MANRTPTSDTDQIQPLAARPPTGDGADPTPATSDATEAATPDDAMGMVSEPALTGGSGGAAGSGRPRNRKGKPKPKAMAMAMALAEEVREVVAANLLATVTADFGRERAVIEIETAAYHYERNVALRGAYFDAQLQQLDDEAAELERALAAVHAGAPWYSPNGDGAA